QIYVRNMLLRRKGYPLWRPKLSQSTLPEIHQREGPQIGDIGILTEVGGFDYLFNVCHDAGHSLNEGR
ncbi:hypothetical protein BDP27DRAFT_1205087, partial [Rhodocollybia butyracea]